MRVESVTSAVCNLAMQFGEGEDAEDGTMVDYFWDFSHSQSRPFGVALLIAGVDTQGPVSKPILWVVFSHEAFS